MLVGLFYPAVYFFILISKIGPKKLITEPQKLDANVYIYIVYLSVSILTVLFQASTDPQDFPPKILMIVLISLVTGNTFGYMRIIAQFSPLVQMLSQVIADLRFFLIMFAVNILIFSLVLSVL